MQPSIAVQFNYDNMISTTFTIHAKQTHYHAFVHGTPFRHTVVMQVIYFCLPSCQREI